MKLLVILLKDSISIQWTQLLMIQFLIQKISIQKISSRFWAQFLKQMEGHFFFSNDFSKKK